MVELICERYLCRYCRYKKCENIHVKKDFENIKTVSKVLLSVDSHSCNKFKEEDSLIDPLS